MATEKPFDLFLSYNQVSAKPAVKDLQQKLKSKYGDTISIWIDYEQWNETPGLSKNEVIFKGLKNSRCILCCVTSGYSKSKECQRELSYAMDVHKGPHAILMLDPHEDLEDEGVKLQIINEARLNFYNNKVSFDMNVTQTRKREIFLFLKKWSWLKKVVLTNIYKIAL